MGYSLDLFIDKDHIHDEFICSICQDVMKQPIMIQGCEHIFCGSCVNDWRQTADTNNTCPTDRKPIVGLRTPIRAFMNIYNGFKLLCWFDKCGVVLSLGQIEDHVKSCQLNPEAIKPCVYNCGGLIKMKDLSAHECFGTLKQQVQKKDLEIDQLKQEFEQKLALKDQELVEIREINDAEVQKLKEEVDNYKREVDEAHEGLRLKDEEIESLKKQVAELNDAPNRGMMRREDDNYDDDDNGGAWEEDDGDDHEWGEVEGNDDDNYEGEDDVNQECDVDDYDDEYHNYWDNDDYDEYDNDWDDE